MKRSSISYCKSNPTTVSSFNHLAAFTSEVSSLSPIQPEVRNSDVATDLHPPPLASSVLVEDRTEVDDHQLDGLLASMVDCAKRFGIQEELDGIINL